MIVPPSEAIAQARQLADAANTLAELEAAVRGFEGLAIRKNTMNTVFSRGNPKAKLMLIGEAPGAQEDQQGIPFCGPSGKLLDKMLAAIGLDESTAYITNTIFWRPPGNRQPSAEELATCRPFVEKHVALVKPTLLILLGGVAAASILQQESSLSRMRLRLFEYSNAYLEQPVQVLVTFHPSYLLRTASAKRLSWQDLLYAQRYLKSKQ